MSGEAMTEAFMGFPGVYGDRCFAFKNSSARKGFPYLNATVQQQMLRYRPQFRHGERAAKPPNVTEAMSIAARLGFHWPDDWIEQKLEMTRRMGAYKTSMQIDREEGRPLETEAIVGKPLRVARDLGVRVPLIEMVYQLLCLL